MLRNHRDYTGKPENTTKAIEQYEWWKPGNSGWVRIDTLTDSHLASLRDYLYRNAYQYFPSEGLGDHAARKKMLVMPLYISIQHEQKARAERAKAEREAKIFKSNRMYLLTMPGSTRTDVVRVDGTNSQGYVHLVDAITDARMWTIPPQDFRQYSTEIWFPASAPKSAHIMPDDYPW